MFDIVNTTLTAAVATSGTFTTPYAAGRNAGNYANSYAHVMMALGKKRLAPVDFSVSFGATTITVTYLGTTTLPIGTYVQMQYDRFGDDRNRPDMSATGGLTSTNNATGSAMLPYNIQRAPTHYIDLGTPATAVTNGASASQTVTGAGTAALLNGSLVVNGVAVFDVPRNVVGAWTNTAIITFTGTDADGNAVVEKSASGASHTGSKAFKTITSITTSATITAATFGTGVKLGLPRYVPDASFIIGEFLNGVALPRVAGKVFIPWEIEETQLLAGTAESLQSPVAGWISKVRAQVQKTVTTGGPVTVEINTVAVTGLTFTVANSDAPGTDYSDTPTTRHGSTTVLAAGDDITITPDAAFATAGELNGILEIDVTAAGQLDGTFVAGVTSAATATTGDTRGTYTGSVTPDAATSYALLVLNMDPAAKGVAQYTG